ncbi:MAG: hypothetical protein KC636_34935, partial [Myxococcales bacterium]|nr:hypothetical protein [Myxococcales bacterium]
MERRNTRASARLLTALLLIAGCGDDEVTTSTTDGGTDTDATTATTDATTAGPTTSPSTSDPSGTDSESGTTETDGTTDEPTTETTDEPTTETTDAPTTETTDAPTTGAVCGDGVVDDGEECDDGPDNGEGPCTDLCLLNVCGDGVLNPDAEACDDAGESALCDADCTLAECGDGVVNALAGESCDGGELADNLICDDTCQASCADGYGDCNDDLLDGCEVNVCGGSCQDPGGMAVFEYSGAIETFELPDCADMLTIEAWGGQGGNGMGDISEG